MKLTCTCWLCFTDEVDNYKLIFSEFNINKQQHIHTYTVKKLYGVKLTPNVDLYTQHKSTHLQSIQHIYVILLPSSPCFFFLYLLSIFPPHHTHSHSPTHSPTHTHTQLTTTYTHLSQHTHTHTYIHTNTYNTYIFYWN